jgi:hypothetical protein
VRLCGNGFRQAGLLQQHRHGVGFGAAVGGGDRGAADGLRQDLLGKFEERLMAFIASGGASSLSLAAPASRAGSSGRSRRSPVFPDS